MGFTDGLPGWIAGNSAALLLQETLAAVGFVVVRIMRGTHASSTDIPAAAQALSRRTFIQE
jgi:hypothetical protein